MRIYLTLAMLASCIVFAHAAPPHQAAKTTHIQNNAAAAKLDRNPAISNIQIIMDRSGFSPGVIDGLNTARFWMQFETFKKQKALSFSLQDREKIAALMAESGGFPFFDYEITAKDLDYKFTPEIPELYVDQASMKIIAFRSPAEMFAERFHMDQRYLVEINSNKNFGKIGEKIRVAASGKMLQTPVAYIEADKQKKQVRAYDSNDQLIAAYPASIGSKSTPSPNGVHQVRNKAQNPAYTYDPNGSAQSGLSEGLVLLPPGPNGPVGDAWIGLSKKTYGIHGTPEPSEIGLTASVGCIRLTNWDALELAKLVKTGVDVIFIDPGS